MTVEYDATRGIFVTACHLHSTAVVNVFYKPEFYFMLVVHTFVSVSHKLDYFTPSRYGLDLAMALTGISGSLMTFFAVFYNGNVFERYTKLYELTKNMNEFCLHAVSIISRNFPNKALQRKLARMVLASAFMFFFERTAHEDHGNISNEEWEQLLGLDLISKNEEILLRQHLKKLGQRGCAMPSYMLLHWSVKLYRAKHPRLNELEKTYWAIRRCQDDVVEIMELPMPFQYFHIMNLMLMLNLTLWSYSLALMDSYFGSLIFFFVQVVFQGMRELSIALADPYGTDDADFPLDDWMAQLYMRVYKIVEDGYDHKRAAGSLGDVPPLVELPAGESVIQLVQETCESAASEDIDSSFEFQMDPNRTQSVVDAEEEEDEQEEEDDDDDD